MTIFTDESYGIKNILSREKIWWNRWFWRVFKDSGGLWRILEGFEGFWRVLV